MGGNRDGHGHKQFLGFGTFQGDSNGTGTEFTNPYTVSSTGITLDSNATDSELNSVDNLAAYLYTGSEDMTTLCGLFGGTDCSPSQSTQTGDITDLGTLASDLGMITLKSWNDSSGLGGTLGFHQTVTDTTQIILLGQGDAESMPEPVSIALPGAGLASSAGCGGAGRLDRAGSELQTCLPVSGSSRPCEENSSRGLSFLVV